MRLQLLRHILAAPLLLGAALLVSAAGRAEGGAPMTPAPEAGGSCQADEGMSLEHSDAFARLAEQLRAAEGESDDDVVVLNGRGYRYDSDRVPSFARDLEQLRMELQRAKAAARQQQP
jgi:hypothetical protein